MDVMKKYLVLEDGNISAEDVTTEEAVQAIRDGASRFGLSVDDYIDHYCVDVYEIVEKVELKVETTVKVEFI